MCNQNRFAVLNQNDNDVNSMIKTTYKKRSIDLIMAPKQGFEIALSRKNRRLIKQGDIILKTESQIRTEAFETLSDPYKMSEKLKKTGMCKYTLRGEKCKRKDCWFAHSEEELKITPCFFGEACRHVYDRTKPCKYLHPHESREEYLIRIKNIPDDDDVPVLY